MAIKTWVEDNKVFYKITVKARGKGDRSLQRQKQESGILDGVKPEEISQLPEEARKKLNRIEIRLAGDARLDVAMVEGAGILWGKFIERWETEALYDKDVLEFLGISEKSSRGYRQAIRDHTYCWDKKPASQITAADFELLVLSMKKTGYANATIYNLKSAINCCYKWGIKKRIIPHITVPPTYGCTISRKYSRRPEVLNTSQIKFLLEEAEKRKHPWYPIWKVVLYTGFRSGEAYALKRRDLDREDKRIMLDTKFNFDSRVEEQLKDHEWRQVPINESLDKFLEELGVWEMAMDDYVLPRIQNWKNGGAARTLRTFCEEIGITSVCFHTLRACWATQLLKNGVAQSKVMIMGGWADLETMQVYLRRAGVEIEGATDSLNFERVPERRERPGRVFRIVGRQTSSGEVEIDSE